MSKIKPGTYKHFKGSLVELLFIAKHSETLEEFVVYKHLGENDESQYWLRPLTMFTESITRDGKNIPRFEKVADSI